GRATGPWPVGQPGHTILVVAMHPVAQRLPVHAAGPCCQKPRMPVQHHCNRQNAPRLLGIRRACRLRPQLRNTQILACNLDCRHAALRESMTRGIDSYPGQFGNPPGVRFLGGWYKWLIPLRRLRGVEFLQTVWKPPKLRVDTSPELVSAIFSGFWRRISVVMTRALSAWFSRANIASPFIPGPPPSWSRRRGC